MTLPYAYAQGRREVIGELAVSYERGTPVEGSRKDFVRMRRGDEPWPSALPTGDGECKVPYQKAEDGISCCDSTTVARGKFRRDIKLQKNLFCPCRKAVGLL